MLVSGCLSTDLPPSSRLHRVYNGLSQLVDHNNHVKVFVKLSTEYKGGAGSYILVDIPVGGWSIDSGKCFIVYPEKLTFITGWRVKHLRVGHIDVTDPVVVSR